MSEENQVITGHRRRHFVTIYDIAKATGVSPSTVSRALHQPGRMNEKTERRIRDAADQLGYSINLMARSLPTGRTGTLGLLLSDITNPVYFDLIRGAQRITAESGSTLILAESQESAEQEMAIARKIIPSIDGLILVASRLDDHGVQQLAAMKPVITVNRRTAGVLSVVPDVLVGLRAAVGHLHDLGHHRIGYLAGPSASWMSRLRWEMLFQAAVAHSMSIVEIGTKAPTLAGGEGAYDRVRAAGVTAVVTYNDLIAIGLMRAYKNAGSSLPEDLSIVGFDDIFGSDLTTPRLTTVRSPLAFAGERAVRLLIDGGGGDFEESELETRLIIRESTGRAPDAARAD